MPRRLLLLLLLTYSCYLLLGLFFRVALASFLYVLLVAVRFTFADVFAISLCYVCYFVEHFAMPTCVINSAND